jgi:four helix bundle protein
MGKGKGKGKEADATNDEPLLFPPQPTERSTMHFEHERLIVYQSSLEFVRITEHLVEDLPAGYAHLRDQLRRAASSIPLNIAEGAGETAINEKRRFYRIARRSAMECAAGIDLLSLSLDADKDLINTARKRLHEIVSMLTSLQTLVNWRGEQERY